MPAPRSISDPRTPPAALTAALNTILAGEMNSIFRCMELSSPYVNRASAELRRPLIEMAQTSQRQTTELSEVIEDLAGVPDPGSPVNEEQYLAYLSFKFLLPKLIAAKQDSIARYEKVLATPDLPDPIASLLRGQLEEHRAHLAILTAAAAKGEKPVAR
jgi:hypothetical protein